MIYEPTRDKPRASALGVVYFGLFFAFFLTFLDRYLYGIGVLPYRQVLFGLFAAPAMVAFVYRAGCSRLWAARVRAILRGERWPLAGWASLVVLSTAWMLHPTAYWGEGIQYPFYVPFYSAVVIFAVLLPAFPAVLRWWRHYFAFAFSVLVITTVLDVFVPGLFGKFASRASGVAVNANDAAMGMVFLASCLIRYRKLRVRDGLLLAVAGAAVFFTLSRGGLILYALLITIYLATLLYPDRRVVRRVLGSAVLMAAVVPVVWVGVGYLIETQEFFSSTYFARRIDMFSGTTDLVPEGESRIQIAKRYVGLIQQAPIVGHGAAFDRAQTGGSPHNMYLAMWVNFGLMGVSLYIALLLISAHSFMRRGVHNGLVFTMIAAAAGVFTHNLLEGFLLPLVLGVLHGTARLEGPCIGGRQSPSEDAPEKLAVPHYYQERTLGGRI